MTVPSPASDPFAVPPVTPPPLASAPVVPYTGESPGAPVVDGTRAPAVVQWAPPTSTARWGTPVYLEPQPYNRILRTSSYGWWRPMLGLPLVFGLWIVASVVGAVVVLLPDIIDGSFVEATPEDLTTSLVGEPLGLLATNLSLAALIPLSGLAMVVAHQLRPTWLHSVLGRMRWGFMARCIGVATALFVVYFVAAAVIAAATGEIADTTPAGDPQLLLALVVLLTTPLQAAGEEYAFRGYLLQAFGSWVRGPVIPVLATSLLFSAIHLGDLPSSVFFFTFGAVAAYLTVKTGGLEAAIGLHVVVNTSQLLLLALSGNQVSSALERSETSWALPVVFGAIMVVYAAIVLRLARRSGLATRTAAVSAPVSTGLVESHQPG